MSKGSGTDTQRVIHQENARIDQQYFGNFYQSPDSQKVPYIDVHVNTENIEETLLEIANYLNVQLKEGKDHIPFLPFDNFDVYQKYDNIFLRAPSGYGKSRIIYELIKQKAKDYKIIYVINPSNGVNISNKKILLSDLKDFAYSYAIIWDNFPSSLPSRNVNEGEKALDIITSGNAKNVFVSLQPDYEDRYKQGIFVIPPEYETLEIEFSSKQMTEFLRSYGENIKKFNTLFTKYVRSNLDQVSYLLWHKDPLPLIVMDYYNELKKIEDSKNYLTIDPVAIAKGLEIVSQYYVDQFRILETNPQHKNDLEFLLSLKFVYDLKLDRTMNFLKKFQYDIFDSNIPITPVRNLSRWIYLSGSEYAMHDLARRSVKISDERALQVFNYLIDNPSLIPDQPANVFAFGKFIGRNFKFLKFQDSELFLPKKIINSIQDKDNFEQGLGKGVAKAFENLNELTQERVLIEASKNGQFGFSFSRRLGELFATIGDSVKIKLLDTASKDDSFASSLFSEMDSFNDVIGIHEKNILEKAFDLAEENTIIAKKLGSIFGFCIGKLNYRENAENIDLILSKLDDNKEFALSFGSSVGQIFGTIGSIKVKNKILEIAMKNQIFSNELFSTLALSFGSLDKILRDQILKASRSDDRIALRLGETLGKTYLTLNDDSFQNRLFNLARKNEDFGNDFAKGIGESFGSVQDNDILDKMLKLARKNSNIASGLGEGIGYIFKSISDKDLQDRILKLARSNSYFAYGLGGPMTGEGLSENFGTINDVDLQDRILKLAIDREEFGELFSEGLGINFPSITNKNLRDKILNLARSNSDFGSLFLTGLLSEYSAHKEELNRFVSNILENDEELVKSIAIGVEYELADIDTNLRDRILVWVETNKDPYNQFGLGLFQVFENEENSSLQDRLLDISMKNKIFAKNLGIAIGDKLYSIKNKDRKLRIIQMVESNESFGRGFGFKLGQNYQSIPFKDFDEIFLKLAEKEIGFSLGLGEGISFGFFSINNKNIRKKILNLTSKNNKFPQGFGRGFGREFPTYHDDVERKLVQELLRTNKSFASGFADGFSYNYGDSQLFNKKILKEFLDFTERNEYCLQGLADSISPYFKYLNKTMQKELIKVPILARTLVKLKIK